MTIYNNVKKVLEEIDLTCAKVGRDPDEIALVAASKYTDSDGIREAYDAGLRHFGENRVLDALEKIESLPSDIHWHMIGHLQKTR